MVTFFAEIAFSVSEEIWVKGYSTWAAVPFTQVKPVGIVRSESGSSQKTPGSGSYVLMGK